jgi:Rieske Fe-S protein
MPDPTRRSFLKFCTNGLGGIFTLLFGAPLVAYVLDPRNRKAPASTMRPVRGVRLSELRIGEPVQGVLRDIRHDAWTLHPNDVVGRVWIVRKGEPMVEDSFKVFTTECPHLGCSINLIPGEIPFFKCPCHEAEFNRDGFRVAREGYTNAAPRAMDALAFRLAPDPENPDPSNRDLLMVEFQKFENTREEKIVRT